MDKRFWGILGAVIVVVIAVAILAGGKGSQVKANPTNNVMGSSKTGVRFVEYGDFQCPACGEWYPTVHSAVQKYSKLIEFQFRNYPLTSLHPNALASSRAAQAAADQGKFWDMYNQLYQQNVTYYASNGSAPEWIGTTDPLPVFVQYAQALNLDVAKFKTDFASEQTNAKIQADVNAGNKLGVTATPTFFLDGEKIDSSQLVDSKTGQPSIDAFSKLFDDAIKQKTGSAPNPADFVKVTEPTAPASNGPLQTKGTTNSK
jgi:protein-disulfide isomerase